MRLSAEQEYGGPKRPVHAGAGGQFLWHAQLSRERKALVRGTKFSKFCGRGQIARGVQQKRRLTSASRSYQPIRRSLSIRLTYAICSCYSESAAAMSRYRTTAMGRLLHFPLGLQWSGSRHKAAGVCEEHSRRGSTRPKNKALHDEHASYSAT